MLTQPSRPPSSIAGELRQPERTAYHEAGHAAAFLALGIELDSVTLRENTSAGARGLTAAIIEEGANLLSLAVAKFAGAEAVRRWDPSREDWQSGAESDFRAAEKYIERAAGPFALTNEHAVRVATLKFRARTVAELLVANHWRAIEALAAELVAAQTLRGHDAARIFHRATERAAAFDEAMRG